ncbi:MAG: DUF1800 domain-containing protein [Aquabacterium sp.]|nr:MAG: DUF1800 domain-containing protein [Aquabacterium sp.]
MRPAAAAASPTAVPLRQNPQGVNVTLPNPLPVPTRAEAARFLGHASLGYTAADIESVRSLGYDAWITRQFAAWRQTSHFDWMTVNRTADRQDAQNFSGELTASVFRRFIEGRDMLRQRCTLALSEIAVTSAASDVAAYQQFGGAAYLDLLETHAFGNWRDLMQGISQSLMMGYYLTFKGSRKPGAAGNGSMPDENYARELLQLFTIGLVNLNTDGTAAQPERESYEQRDIETLARVFTGWDQASTSGLEYWRTPMTNNGAYFDDTLKEFSATFGLPAIPAGLGPVENLKRALDGIFAHPNLAPFISRQLIQRFVTSNPSPAYVGRVTAAFLNNGSGVKGDMKAVLRAILMDEDLFDATGRRIGGLDTPGFGKLREPAVRFIQWARAFNVRSRSTRWNLEYALGNLGQLPMYSPSVFNFFRPGYVPPGGGISQTQMYGSKMVAPEFQITNETSVVRYVSFMKAVIESGINGDIYADWAPWLPKVTDPQGLVAELNVLLTAGQLGADTLQIVAEAVGSIPMATGAQREKRIKAAALLIVSAPEFIAQK